MPHVQYHNLLFPLLINNVTAFIVEHTLEWNTGLYLVFVGFEKAFDSLDWEVLWMILQHYQIPEKTERMILVFYDGFQARVLRDGDMTEPFSMSNGVPAQPPSLPRGAGLGISSSPW